MFVNQILTYVYKVTSNIDSIWLKCYIPVESHSCDICFVQKICNEKNDVSMIWVKIIYSLSGWCFQNRHIQSIDLINGHVTIKYKNYVSWRAILSLFVGYYCFWHKHFNSRKSYKICCLNTICPSLPSLGQTDWRTENSWPTRGAIPSGLLIKANYLLTPLAINPPSCWNYTNIRLTLTSLSYTHTINRQIHIHWLFPT